MKHPFDTATAALASGLSRRNVLKTVLSSVAAGMSIRTIADSEPVEAAAEHMPTADPTEVHKALELKLLRVNPNTKGVTKLFLRDRLPARITAPGQKTVALVPHFLDGIGGVELSLYEHPSMTFAGRLSVPLRNKPVSPNVALLPGVAFAASRFVRVLPEPPGEDCCVSCCNGYNICASGVCCNTNDPSCGNCCDYGSCQPTCNCCS